MNARDAALLRRWSEHRDAEAFNDLVSHYADMVYATCKRTLGNPADAEELTQECFLKLATGNVRIRTSLGGWLHSAATSLSINRLRSDARRRRREEIALAEIPTTTEPAWNDIQRFVDQAIAELPEDLRDPLIRHFLQRETHDQIAHDLGLTRSAVTKRVAHGIERVRERLKKDGVLLTTAALAALASEHLAEAAPATLKAALGRLALSGAIPTAAVAATGMTLLSKAILAVAVTVMVGLGATVTYRRYEPATPTAFRQQPATSAANTVPAQTKQVQSGVQPTSSSLAAASNANTSVNIASVSGRVYDQETQQGIAGVKMLLSCENIFRLDATTDERGEYRFDELPASIWRLRVMEANGYYIGSENADLRAKHTRELKLKLGENRAGVDFALGRGEGIRGIAAGADGKPMPGAIVTAFTEVNNYHIVNTAESAEDGSFYVSGFPPTVSLYVWADKDNLTSTATGPYALPQGDRALDPVVLQAEAILRGTVVDTQGKPLPALNITPQFGPNGAYRVRETLSGPDGRFELKGMPPCTALVRVCRDVEIVNSPITSVTLAAGQVVDNLVLTCAVGSQRISGRVVDAKGNGLSWATVECRGGEPPQQTRARTKGDGSFVIEALGPGTYTLTAIHQDYLQAEPQQASAGSSNVRFVMPEAVSVEGRVLDAATGKPVPVYLIKYSYPNFEDEAFLDQRYEKNENPDGSFKLRVANLGDMKIAVRQPGYLMALEPLSVDGTYPIVPNVIVRLKPQPDLKGKVHDTNGAAVAGALIFSGGSILRMEDSYASARTGDDGTFVLPALKLAHESISVFHPNYPKLEVPLEPKHYAGEPIEVAFVSGTKLACTILCNGVPFQGAHVNVSIPREIRSQHVETGPDGKAVIETLPPGEYQAELQLPPSSEQTTGAHIMRAVTLTAGQTTELTVDFARGDATISGQISPVPASMRITLSVNTDQGEQKYYRFFDGAQSDPSSFAFPDLPSGEASMTVQWSAPDNGAGRQSSTRRYAFTLTTGTAVRQDINTDGGVALWGTVGPIARSERGYVHVACGDLTAADPFGKEVDQNDCASIPVADDGTFRIENIPPGLYTIIATTYPREKGATANPRAASILVNLGAQGQEVNLQVP